MYRQIGQEQGGERLSVFFLGRRGNGAAAISSNGAEADFRSVAGHRSAGVRASDFGVAVLVVEVRNRHEEDDEFVVDRAIRIVVEFIGVLDLVCLFGLRLA